MRYHLPVAGTLIRNVVTSGWGAGSSIGPRRQIRVIVVARRGRRPGIIGVLVWTAGRRIVFHPGTRGRAASVGIAVIVAWAHGAGRAFTIVFPGAVSTGRREPSVVFIHGWVGPAWGARPVRVTVGTVFMALDLEKTMRRGVGSWGANYEGLICPDWRLGSLHPQRRSHENL